MALLVDQVDFAGADLLVYARAAFFNGRRRSHRTTNGLSPLAVAPTFRSQSMRTRPLADGNDWRR
jgi:hypothetical protein